LRSALNRPSTGGPSLPILAEVGGRLILQNVVGCLARGDGYCPKFHL